MSLDFYLIATSDSPKCPSCGHALEQDHYEGEELFHSNITHNLINMFEAAGVYRILWKGSGLIAKDVLSALRGALQDMSERPNYYKTYDSPNGWGLYVNAVPWLERIVAACERYPTAKLECSP